MLEKTTRAPWTDGQVNSINAFQASDFMHPFTCLSGHVLVAREDGFFCPECLKEQAVYHQGWCHEFMADWSWEDIARSIALLCQTAKGAGPDETPPRHTDATQDDRE